VAYALMCLTILAALRCDDADLSWQQRLSRLGLVTTLTLLLGFTHPYEHAMLFASYAGFLLWTALVPRTRPLIWQRVPVLVALGIGSGIVVGYFFWLRSQPVWDYVTEVSSKVPFDPIIWIFGYGMLLPLAFLGATVSATKPAMERANWPIAWM